MAEEKSVQWMYKMALLSIMSHKSYYKVFFISNINLREILKERVYDIGHNLKDHWCCTVSYFRSYRICSRYIMKKWVGLVIGNISWWEVEVEAKEVIKFCFSSQIEVNTCLDRGWGWGLEGNKVKACRTIMLPHH